LAFLTPIDQWAARTFQAAPSRLSTAVARTSAAGFFARADGPVALISAASHADRPLAETATDTNLIAVVAGTNARTAGRSAGSGTSSSTGMTNSSSPAGNGAPAPTASTKPKNAAFTSSSGAAAAAVASTPSTTITTRASIGA
jgi:hypothetical protein